jgi:uncharacterized protein DUF4232
MTAFHRTRTPALVAAIAVAAFFLTACGDDETAQDGNAGQAGNESPSGQDDTTDGGSDTSSNDYENEQNEETGAEPGQGGSEGGDGQGDGQSEEDEADTVPCTDANTEVTFSDVERPINHLLLTVTNTGDEACSAYHAPFLGYDGAQAALPFVEDSRPQSVTVLRPGESAFAGVTTSSGDASQEGGHTVTSLTLDFASAEGNGSVGGQEDLPLPGGEAYLDDAATVTYWLPTMDDALMW